MDNGHTVMEAKALAKMDAEKAAEAGENVPF